MNVGTKIILSAKDNASKVFSSVASKVKGLDKNLAMVSSRFDHLQKKTKNIQSAFTGIGSVSNKIGTGLAVGVTAPLAMIATKAFTTAHDFQAAMNGVEAKAKVVGKSIADLNVLAKELGATTKFSAVEAAGAMDFLAMAGWNTKQIFEGLPAVLDLASAGGSSIELAADVASNIMGAFRIDASQMGRVSDVLASTLTSFNVNMEQLADSMKYASPVAKEFGASLESTAIAAGLMGNIGIQGSQAGTALRAMFARMAAPPKEAREAFEALGVAINDNNGKLKPFEKILGQVAVKMKGLSQADKLKAIKNIFGQEALAGGAGLVAAIESGDFETALIQFQNIDGAAKRMAGIMQKGAVGAMTNFKSAFEGLMIAIGESGIVEVVASLATSLTNLMQKIQMSDPKLLRLGVLFAGVAALLAPMFIGFGFVATGVTSLITAFNGLLALKAVWTVFWAKSLLASTSLSAAIGALVAKFLLLPIAIGLIAYSLHQLITRWDDVKLGFLLSFDAIANGFENLWNSFKGTINKMIDYVPDFLKFGFKGFDVKSKVQLENEQKIDRQKIFDENNVAKRAPISAFSQVKNEVNKFINETKTTTENKVVVDFKNMPQGVKVDTKKVQDKNIGVNYGFQGATK